MFIYADSYHCSACGAHGRTSNLLNDLKQKQRVFVPKKEISFHSPWQRWERSYGSLENVIDRTHVNLLRNNKTAYLYKRGLDLQTIKQLRLGWMDDWITFPIYDDEHNLIGATARTGESNKTPNKYCNYPGQSPDLLYAPNWEVVQLSKFIILVFGIIDAISLYQLGFPGISTTIGKRHDPCCLDDIRKKIYIIPDRGEEIDASLLSAKLSWRGKAISIDWADDCKDVNDMFTKHKLLLLETLEKLYDHSAISK